MGKRHSKRGSKKGKSKKNRAKNNESNLSKEQSKQKNSYDEIAEIFFGTKQEQKSNANTKNISEGSVENTSEDASNKNETDAKDTTINISDTTSADVNQCYEEIKAKQQELLNNLKNLNDALSSITLTRDNIASLRVEVLSNIYFTREVRPLIDAVNLIAFASSNMSTVAQNININTFGDRKEIKNAFKLCYKMNDEVEELLGALTRRIKLYVAEIDSMDRNCPPFNYDEDS
ncbi:hypothetical protein [Clostridium saccharoperbutylacetonicum]|uniref:hypothetical protein n=1 Tax=Clostridium saccharoperbutylacetonicum TaxID=36745 RepID=UPI000983B755|nr:hypothetical protein [Clostridium saccharoperbutylacetonicum]AQR96911.1 hypothetical protein CLSAP_42350 [Clostridium saccharoperbutylacetonicum]NSB32790.1 hypothetical protein [Clostridium saccharoperbutylacetonicum]